MSGIGADNEREEATENDISRVINKTAQMCSSCISIPSTQSNRFWHFTNQNDTESKAELIVVFVCAAI